MAAGDPTGEDLCVGTTNGNTLPEYGDEPGWEEREITLGDGTELTSGVKYAIVASAVIDGDAEIFWSTRVDDPTADGNLYKSSNSGDTWTSYSTQDSWFKTKANGVEKDDGSFEEDEFDRATQFYGATWKAETFTADSTYTITSVILKLCKYTTWGGTPGTITVSIRETSAGPIKAKTPAPIDTTTGMTLDYQEFSWVSGTETPPDEEVYNVYWGTTSGALSQIVEEGSTTSMAVVFLIATIGAGLYNETYYWRVDTYWPSTEETAEGDEWWFSTIAFNPPLPTGVTLAGGDGDEGDPTGTPSGLNFMIAIRRLVVAANSKIYYENI